MNLQEAVLGRAREAVWNDEEIFFSPLTLNCHGVTNHWGSTICFVGAPSDAEFVAMPWANYVFKVTFADIKKNAFKMNWLQNQELK